MTTSKSHMLAFEIKRLRAEVSQLRDENDNADLCRKATREVQRLRDEVERLREQVRQKKLEPMKCPMCGVVIIDEAHAVKKDDPVVQVVTTGLKL